MTTMTTTIPASAFAAFVTALAKLNRRASKLGCSPLEIVSNEAHTVEIDGIKFPAITLEIAGTTPTFAGWTFAASVEALDSGKNIFHGVSTSFPARFSTSGHSCEHCNQNRKRNSSFILSHEAGDYKQVGSTCINDFLGGNHLPVFNFLSNAREILSEFESFANATIDSVSVIGALVASAATVREHGFVKKTGHDVYSETVPTASKVESFLIDVRNPKRFIPNITEADEAKAEAVRAWLINHEGTQNDYLQKLIDLAAATRVSSRNIGILASSIAAYDRELERKAQVLASPSNHVGTVGKRETFTVSLTGCKVLPDYGYGCSNLYSFKDAQGNILKWKTQAQLEHAGTFKITGTVKSHGAWNGVSETELTR
jgi:hypothetical protein